MAEALAFEANARCMIKAICDVCVMQKKEDPLLLLLKLRKIVNGEGI